MPATSSPWKRRLWIATGLTAIVVGGTGIALAMMTSLGSLPHGERLARVQASSNYVDGAFRNLVETSPDTQADAEVSSLTGLFPPSQADRIPAAPLPSRDIDLRTLDIGDDRVVWLGHSTVYLQLAGKRFLIDPVLGLAGAPFAFLNRAFPGTRPYDPAKMPPIDFVLISHDHWDHLDYPTIVALKAKVAHFVVPLGLGAHLERWGVSPDRIVDLDWWQAIRSSDTTIHAVPARHLSGRFLTRNQWLWAGFVIDTGGRKIFYSGDGGYGAHFAEIGRRFGLVDLAIMEDGQYDPRWPKIHMTPEQSSQAAVDVRARAVLPGHFGKFAMANHGWSDPIVRFTQASENKPYVELTPVMGQPVPIVGASALSKWW